MIILINTATTYKGGGVQVARSFIEECRSYKEHEYYVILGDMLSDLIDAGEYPENFSFYNIGYRPASRIFSFKPHNKELKNIEDKIKPDVVFTTSGPAYWRPKSPHLVGYNLPHYIYRDSPFFPPLPFHKRLKWDLKGKILRKFFQRDADAYVVQTEDVNRRLKRWLQSEKVYTVSNTFSRHYMNSKKVPDKLPPKRKDEFRFLTLSAWYEHKNMQIIPKVIDVLPERLKDRIRFVLTLPQEVFKSKFSSEPDEQIINIGPVRPDEGPALYKECDALFLPTLLECFSASYAEAMKMEKPILTSDLDFAHTVCGDAALYADPMNPNLIAGKMAELIENPGILQKLIKKGKEQQRTFPTARERAGQYLKIIKDLGDAGKN